VRWLEGRVESDASWVRGQAEPGSGRGRSLGFPTANLKLENELLRPADGVYAVQVKIEGEEKKWLGAMHVGPRPTFMEPASVEVHIINWPGEKLYGKWILFKLVQRLRRIEDFGTADKLSAALAKDVEQAKQILKDIK